MPDHLYRFRSIERILGPSQELEKQEIYFAPPSQLNDPMEGFRDLFWAGDDVAWTNIFRHYLLCLSQVYCQYEVLQGNENIQIDRIPFDRPRNTIIPPVMALQDKAITYFFEHEEIHELIEVLAARTTPVRSFELHALLHSAHSLALSAIKRSLEEAGLSQPLTPNQSESLLKDARHFLSECCKQFRELHEHYDNENISLETQKIISEAAKNLQGQIDLLRHYNTEPTVLESNRRFLFFQFTQIYIQQLELLTYPKWYAACFMEDCKNSSAWGHYAASHSGICLKFKIDSTTDRPTIYLNRICGWDSNGPIRDFVPHSFHKVRYDSEHMSVDFFRSLGSLPVAVINQDWHYYQGKRSICADGLIGITEKSRRKYWDDFSAGITIKTEDWMYEKEHRLIINGGFIDFSDPKERCLKYAFSSLDGIIFGIKTSIEDKIKVIKIIEEKCKIENRSEFNFYQAYYSPQSKMIEHFPLNPSSVI